MSEHTDWYCKGGMIASSSDPTGETIAIVRHPEQAALIVRAVNSHAALVEALEKTSEYFAAVDAFQPSKKHGSQGDYVRNLIRAALALEKAQQ